MGKELGRVEIRSGQDPEIALINAIEALRAAPGVQDWETQQRRKNLETGEPMLAYVKIRKNVAGDEYLIAEYWE